MREPKGSTADESQDDAPGIARRALRWFSALLLLGLMAGAGHQLLRWEPHFLPIRVVTVDGELKRLSPQRLQKTVIDHIRGGIVTQNLAELKAAAEDLAWVSSASLRRLWPDRLELKVVEHEPLARWGEDGLVSFEGVVFRPPIEELLPAFARLNAADARAQELVDRYQSWSPRFAAVGLAIEEVTLDARGAWTIGTNAGFDLALGTLQIEERADRFLRAWPSLVAYGRPAVVDMRYSNGLAVAWRQNGAEGAESMAGERSQAGTPVGADADRQAGAESSPVEYKTGGQSPRPLYRALGPGSVRS